MQAIQIPELVSLFIGMNDGNVEQAAKKLGVSSSNLSRWKSGQSRPRPQLESRLRSIVEGTGDLVVIANTSIEEAHVRRLEEGIAGTIHELREEFHRTASISTRQEVLDLVAALFFSHVTSIDRG